MRVEYAEGSLKPEDAGIYRTAPLMAKTRCALLLRAPRFLPVHGEAQARRPGVAAIGDDGQGHKALYWGESVTPVKPGEVFAKLADDTWRRYVRNAG